MSLVRTLTNVAESAQHSISEEIEPSIDEKKVLNTLGGSLLRSIRPVIKTIIAQLRAKLIIESKKKLENNIKQRQFLSDLDKTKNIANTLQQSSNFIDNLPLPLETLKGIPPVYESLQRLRQSANDISSEARNLDYRVSMMNNKEIMYDSVIQSLDSIIKRLKGYLKHIESEMEKGSI